MMHHQNPTVAGFTTEEVNPLLVPPSQTQNKMTRRRPGVPVGATTTPSQPQVRCCYMNTSFELVVLCYVVFLIFLFMFYSIISFQFIFSILFFCIYAPLFYVLYIRGSIICIRRVPHRKILAPIGIQQPSRTGEENEDGQYSTTFGRASSGPVLLRMPSVCNVGRSCVQNLRWIIRNKNIITKIRLMMTRGCVRSAPIIMSPSTEFG